MGILRVGAALASVPLVVILAGGCGNDGVPPATHMQATLPICPPTAMSSPLNVFPSDGAVRVATLSSSKGAIQGVSGCNYPAHVTLNAPLPWLSSVEIVDVSVPDGLYSFTESAATSLYTTLSNPSASMPYNSWMSSEYGIPQVAWLGTHTTIPYPDAYTASSPSFTYDAGAFKQKLTSWADYIPHFVATINRLYVIHLPSNMLITSGSLLMCRDFWGYHGFLQDGSGGLLYFVVLPDFELPACAARVPSLGGQAVQQLAEAHEIFEALTDPDGSQGWIDGTQPAACAAPAEIGDICAGLPAAIAGGGGTVTVQKMWSNLANDCVTGDTTPTIESITPTSGQDADYSPLTVSVAGERFGPGTTFQFGGSNATNVVCASSKLCTMTPPYYNGSSGVTVQVTASHSGLVSSWDGVQDNFSYQCAPFPTAFACGSQTCGYAPNGCGGRDWCGCCPSAAQACGTQQCGSSDTGCGYSVSCGSCPLGNTCAGGRCHVKCPRGYTDCYNDGQCIRTSSCM